MPHGKSLSVALAFSYAEAFLKYHKSEECVYMYIYIHVIIFQASPLV